MDGLEAKHYCQALLDSNALSDDDVRKKKKKKKAYIPPEFLRDKPDDSVLLVYPFAGDASLMETAADGLNELSAFRHSKSDLPVKGKSDTEEESGGSRSHYLTISVGDCRRLDPGVYLNDTLIDFFMQW